MFAALSQTISHFTEHFKYAELRNIRLSYTDSGEGSPVLIFLHGLGAYAHSWNPLIESLHFSYRCIAIDLPGHGHSDVSSKGYHFNVLGQYIQEFLNQLAIKEYVLVGHSMGGQLAMHLVLNHFARPKKLVLLATAGFEQFNWWEQQFIFSGMSWVHMMQSPSDYAQSIVDNCFYRKKELKKLLQTELLALVKRHSSSTYNQVISAYIKAMLQEVVLAQLHQIKQPALVIYGEKDALIPNPILHPQPLKELARFGAEQLHDATLHILPEAGHLIHWEERDRVLQLMVAFLEE